MEKNSALFSLRNPVKSAFIVSTLSLAVYFFFAFSSHSSSGFSSGDGMLILLLLITAPIAPGLFLAFFAASIAPNYPLFVVLFITFIYIINICYYKVLSLVMNKVKIDTKFVFGILMLLCSLVFLYLIISTRNITLIFIFLAIVILTIVRRRIKKG